MSWIYLATPYSHSDPAVKEVRFQEAARIAGHLMQQGEIVFCPITHTHPIAVAVNLPGDWQKFDEEFIAGCSKVLVAKMPGWETSKGIAGEIDIAKRMGKPVEYLEIHQP